MANNKFMDSIITNITNIVNINEKKEKLDESIDSLYNCPYCGYKINEKNGYHECEECKKNYRIYKEKIYRDEETINDILYYFIKILTHISNVDGNISGEKLDYLYNIVKNEIKLDKNKIKWCASVFKETSKEVYTSEVIKKFKNSLKKYYGHNYNIERLSMFKWLINIYNMNEIAYENQGRIIDDYIKLFNITESDYIYINYPEVSMSRE